MTEIRNMFPEGTPARRVINYAMMEFFQKGVRQVTMDDIAKGLQMSKRTLYQLFADKEQLIIACIEVLAEHEQQLAVSLIEENRNVLEIILRIVESRLHCLENISLEYIEDITRYKSVVEFIEMARKESIKRAVVFFQQGFDNGLFRPDVNFDIVMNSMVQKIDNVVRSYNGNTYPARDCFINEVLFHLRGCCTAKGIELIDTFLERYKAESNSDK